MWEIPADGHLLATYSTKPFKPRTYETRAFAACSRPCQKVHLSDLSGDELTYTYIDYDAWLEESSSGSTLQVQTLMCLVFCFSVRLASLENLSTYCAVNPAREVRLAIAIYILIFVGPE